jgi:PAS domain S-box-containing protein
MAAAVISAAHYTMRADRQLGGTAFAGLTSFQMDARATSFEEMAAKLEELVSYIGVTDGDSRILAELLPFARPRFPAIADEFYAVIRMHAGASAVLKDEEQAKRLHASLQVWLGELLSGPYDGAYYDHHARIGQVHVRVGLPAHYMVTAMSRIRAALQRIAGEAFAAEPARDAEARLAVARACDLDLAIMLESYREDLAARLDRLQLRERAALEERLEGRRRFLLKALDAADVALFGFDRAGTLLFINKKAESLTGWDADEILNTDPFETFFGDRAAAVRKQLLAPARASVELEGELRTRAGRTRIVRLHGTARSTQDDDTPTVVVVGIDLTEQRELERSARQAERLATAGALAAGLAHEIRNPLNGANLHLSVLDRALSKMPDAPQSAHGAVVVLRNEIRRLSALVSDFLEVARPRPLARIEVDLNDIVAGVVTLLEPEATQRNTALRTEPCPLPAKARVDVERVKQVLLNLVRNGFEALGNGGTVCVRVHRRPADVELEVEDDGPGIPDPAAPIFDAFYTTKERGTGLGLSIVHRIISDHGGDISFRSRPGCTVFVVRLPVEPPPAGSAPGTQRAEGEPRG